MPVLRSAVLAMLLASSLAATPRYLSFGRVSLLGLLTAALVGLSALAVLSLRGPKLPAREVLYLLGAFVALDLVSMAWTPVTQTGIQDSIVWTGTFLSLVLGLRMAQLGPGGWRMTRGVWEALIPVTAVIAIVQWLLGLESATTPLVLGLAVCLGAGVWAAQGNARSLAIALAGIALSLMLLARAPALAGIVCLLVANYLAAWQSRGLKLLVAALLPLLAVAAVAGSLAVYPALVNTMFGGDSGVQIAGVNVNTSGRVYWWAVVLASAAERPLLGHGIDVAPSMLGLERWSHPHNDYLRLLHHSGIVGLGLWILAWWRAAMLIRRRVMSARRQSISRESLEVARVALLLIIYLALTMLSDNVVVYSYVILPIALVTGLALGSRYWTSELP